MESMTTTKSEQVPPKRKRRFVHVGENLYRYSSNRVYYAVFKHQRKLIWKSLETSDYELAKRKRDEELERAGKVDIEAARMSLDSLLKLYEENVCQYDAKTRKTRISILGIFRESWSHGFDVLVRKITQLDLELWLAGHRQRLKHSSFNEYVRFVRQLFEIAVKQKAIAASPAVSIKELRRQKPIRLSPSWDQFLAIVQAIRGQRFTDHAEDTADLVEFMGRAGVGTAECGNLCGEHVDFRNSRITLYRQKTETGYTIPIFPQLLLLLEKLRDQGRVQNGQSVFRVTDPKKALAAACVRLNLPNFSPRSLRRCFITRAVEKGVDFKTIAAWQGHSDGGALIAKTYSHLRTEHSDAMAKKMME